MTVQIRDRLIYSGENYYLNEELLEGYFEEYPEKRPESKVSCSALWRGYRATFEIKDEQLLVDKLEMFADIDPNLKITKELFPNNNKFEWYSGLIRIDEYRGEWDDENEDAIFEYLEIYKGDLIQKRTMDFEELQIFKEYQFEYFKITEEYNKAYSLWRNNNPKMDVNKIDKYIYEGLLQRYSREIFDNKKVW